MHHNSWMNLLTFSGKSEFKTFYNSLNNWLLTLIIFNEKWSCIPHGWSRSFTVVIFWKVTLHEKKGIYSRGKAAGNQPEGWCMPVCCPAAALWNCPRVKGRGPLSHIDQQPAVSSPAGVLASESGTNYKLLNLGACVLNLKNSAMTKKRRGNRVLYKRWLVTCSLSAPHWNPSCSAQNVLCGLTRFSQ